ncbi:MAG TPA: hypothetical protein VH396_14620 [Chitinophagaceae bacterium]|jgi:hypothetical protein
MKKFKKQVFAQLLFYCSLFCTKVSAQADTSLKQKDSFVKQKDTAKTSPPADIIEIAIRLFNIDTTHKPRSTKKVNFSLLPAGASVPGGGAAVVTTLNAAFYTGNNATTNLSTVDFTPVFTTTGKILISLKSSIWLKNNIANISGETRYFNYPDYTWGLGGNSPEDNRSILNFQYIRFYQSALRKITGPLSAGIGYRFDRYYNIEEELEDSSKASNLSSYPYGTGSSSQSSAFILQALYDSRKNSINPPGGKYFSLIYRNNPGWLGSDYSWQSLFVDARIYFPLKDDKRKLLAFRTYYWTTLGGNVPYLDLPAHGWDYTAYPRGIRRSRYRSNALIYGESEFRFDISQNGFWGGVAFVNCLSASEFGTQKFSAFHPAAGCGVRIKFNKYSGSNVALDFAFSKNFYGVYVNLGEAF